MAINAYLLCEGLRRHTMKRLNTSRYVCALSYVTWYIPGLFPREDTIYLVSTPEQLSGFIPDIGTWIVIGAYPQIQSITESDMICMPQAYSLQKLYDQVCHIMEIYRQWEQTLQQVLSDGGDAHALCQISVPYLGNPMMMATDDGEIVGVGMLRGNDYSRHLREADTDYLSRRRTHIIRQNQAHFEKIHAPIFHYLDDTVPTLMLNIFVHDVHKGILYVDARNKPFNDGDYSRICILGKYLEQYLQLLTRVEYRPLNRFRTQFLRYLLYQEGTHVIQHDLEQIGWHVSDHYRCSVIPKIGEAAETISLDGLCRDYEQSCSNCITVQDTQIYLLHNLTRSGKKPEEIERELTAVNQKYRCNAGISTVFSDFFACRSYFDQAQAAYETGHAIDETKPLYNFDAYRLPYLLHNGLKKLPFELLLPEEMLWLKQLDAENQSEYSKTLGVYLLCKQNITLTAERLYLHRSTLKYRLQKIRELVGDAVFTDTGLALSISVLYRYEMQMEQQKGGGWSWQ